MAYFTQDFIVFFQELKENNHKEWFHSQKKRYESQIKNPFEAFIGALIERIQEFDPELSISAKDCILRINRDIRFSKDKTPYNLHRTAFVSRGGRKDKSIPGLFLRLSPEHIGIMGGCFGPSKEQLQHIRHALTQDASSFRALIAAPDFVEKFGELKGDKMKRVPKDMREAAEQEPLLLNKQFYFSAMREAALIPSDNLMDEIMTYWHAAKAVNTYLQTIIQSA
ncbi:MAG: DUF2461 domain-containing protein [Bacteroidota bacterium]